MNESKPAWGRWCVWGAVVLLAILHQDIWLWDNRSLIFGFLPAGLAYHAMFSILCAVLWACAIRFAWPHHIEEWAEAGSDDEGAGS